jgi:hypothetical protein
MNDHPEKFELPVLQTMLERLHDAAIDYQPETVDRMNEMKEVAWKYLRSRKLSSQQWELIRGLLSHPKSTVRIWVAVEFLNIGITDVWSILIKEAEPMPPRTDQPIEERMRNTSARQYAWSLLYMIDKKFTHLNLRPTYAEIRAQWVAEGKW